MNLMGSNTLSSEATDWRRVTALGPWRSSKETDGNSEGELRPLGSPKVP